MNKILRYIFAVYAIVVAGIPLLILGCLLYRKSGWFYIYMRFLVLMSATQTVLKFDPNPKIWQEIEETSWWKTWWKYLADRLGKV
jgi:hypothetical protein